MIFSAITNAVTSTTTLYVSPSSYNNDGINDKYVDVFDSADITKTTISYVSPFNDIDTEPSAVSVVNEATSSYDLSNNNPSSLNYNIDLHFDTVLYLVLTEILLYDQQNVTCTMNILRLGQLTLLSYNTLSSTVRAITLNTYNTIYDLYFNTVIAIIVVVAVGA